MLKVIKLPKLVNDINVQSLYKYAIATSLITKHKSFHFKANFVYIKSICDKLVTEKMYFYAFLITVIFACCKTAQSD